MHFQSPFRFVILAGGVAASATAGALIAMGHRLGRAAEPFVAMGEVLARWVPSASAMTGASMVLAGLVVHVVAIAVWTLVFVWLVAQMNRSAFAAFIVGVANFFVSWLVARFAGVGVASVLPLGDRLTLSATLAVALLVGMRYARSSSDGNF